MKHIRQWLVNHPIDWRMAQLYGLLLVLFGIIQFSAAGLVDVDGYYHIKMADLIRTEGFTPNFKWLPYTILNADDYVNHHFLYHVFLVPFTLVGNLVLAGKLGTIVFASLAVFLCGLLLKNEKISGAEFWPLIIFASSTGFLFRMSMTRSQSLSLVWLMLAIIVLLRKDWKWLVAIGWSYVWLYNAFPLILVVVIAYMIAGRITDGTWYWKPLMFTGIGVVLGVVINPYFPKNLTFIYDHLFTKLDIDSVAVGMEWYPYDSNRLLENSLVAFIAFFIGVFAWGYSREKMSLSSLFMFGLTVFFGFLVFQSKRFIEYFPPFPVLFAAFTLHPILKNWKPRWYYFAGIGVILLGCVGFYLYEARKDLSASDNPTLFTGSSQWLTKNTPRDSIVFQTDWDDFGRLFHYNPHNVYIVGLDPTYLSLENKPLFEKWKDLTQGRGGENWGEVIKKEFDSCFAITDLKHTNFINRADKDENFKLVYKDANSAVYQYCEQE